MDELWMRDVEELSDKVIWQPARQANNQTVAKQSNKRRLNMETLCDMSQTQSEERQENQIRTDKKETPNVFTVIICWFGLACSAIVAVCK